MAAPSSEISGKAHPYQLEQVPGAPKGAFEARKVRAGLYIRVDMPGVPNDDVKVVKYNETNTVTFSGKAPPLWPAFDSPETRIYAGYVVVDRDISDVDFVYHHKNGCLRFFFPRCDGSLHFLSPPQNPNTIALQDDPTGQDEDDKITDEPFSAFILHDPNNPSGISLAGGSSEDINPYLLSGVKGVYEHKILTLTNGDELIYVRVDVPDTCRKSACAVVDNSTSNIMFKASAFKKEYYSRFDEVTREYHGILSPACQCCNFDVVKFEISSGVLRFLVSKTGTNNLGPSTNLAVPPSRPARRFQPLVVDLFTHLNSGSTSNR